MAAVAAVGHIRQRALPLPLSTDLRKEGCRKRKIWCTSPATLSSPQPRQTTIIRVNVSPALMRWSEAQTMARSHHHHHRRWPHLCWPDPILPILSAALHRLSQAIATKINNSSSSKLETSRVERVHGQSRVDRLLLLLLARERTQQCPEKKKEKSESINSGLMDNGKQFGGGRRKREASSAAAAAPPLPLTMCVLTFKSLQKLRIAIFEIKSTSGCCWWW